MAKTGCAEQVVKIEKGPALFDKICLDSAEAEEDKKEK
jgi:hypothetical protein